MKPQKATPINTPIEKPKLTPKELAARAEERKRRAEIKRALIANEDRPAKLRRIGMERIKKAVNTIRLIGNLAAYKPTDEQIDKIMEALGGACAAIDARLRGTRKSDVDFNL